MQFVKPLPFAEAIQKLGARTPIGSDLTSAQWRDVPVALRERALFSSQVESLRFLQRAKDHVGDFLTGAREVLPDGQTALKLGSRAEFVKQLSAFAQAEGLGPLDPKDAGTIKDITSQKRLELIFDVQTHQAQAYGDWKQGSDPDVLDEFPAQRFIRVHDVKEPRTWHTQFENGVWLKSDVAAWIRINQDFGVPWGPWGWGCGHDVEDVDRAEAEQLGLIQPGETPTSPELGFNSRLEASTRGLDPEFVNLMRQSFGDQIEITGDAMQWRGASGSPRPAALTPSNPVEVKPALAGKPTLESVLDQLGLTNKQTVTAQDMTLLREELKESNPLQASQVLRDVVGGPGVLSERGLKISFQQFVDFVPPEKLKALPKLRLETNNSRNEGGHYSPGTKTVVLSAANVKDADERQRVMFHEAMHWLHMEGSREFQKAITDHWEARTRGEKAAPLPGYGSPGKKDKWYDAYAGKIYSQYETEGKKGLEVPTRYMEWLTKDPAEMARLWNDLDFRETMVIVLRNLF